MFSTIPNQTPAKDTDTILQALAQHIRQQCPNHRVVAEYSHEDNHFLKIYMPYDKDPERHHPITYCHINYENGTIIVLGQNFTTEINIDLANPDSITQFDQALSQLMMI